MTLPKDGGPAFPVKYNPCGLTEHQPTLSVEQCHGMSMRDWFAGMALQGMMASESSGDGIMPRYEPAATWERRTATKAYQFAEAMLAELAERNK